MKTAVSFLATIALTALCASGGMAQKAHANALVADLSKDQIRVASNALGQVPGRWRCADHAGCRKHR